MGCNLKENAQIKIGFAGLLIFFILITLVSAQELQEENEKQSNTGQEIETPIDQPAQDLAVPAQEEGIEPPKEELPQDPALNSPQLTVVSPLYGEEVSGSVLVIAAILPAEKITAAFFEIENTKKELTQQNNFTEVFDSRQLEDGEYKITVQACIQDNCITQTLPIKISNNKIEPEQKPTEEPPVIELPDGTIMPRPGMLVSIKGSNIFSALTVMTLEGKIIAAGTDYLEVPQGTYSLQNDFFEYQIHSVRLKTAQIKASGIIFEINELKEFNTVTPPKEQLEFQKILELNVLSEFESGEIYFNEPAKGESLLICMNWNSVKKNCEEEFQAPQQEYIENKNTIKFSQQSMAIAYAKKTGPAKKHLVVPSNLEGKFAFYTKEILIEAQNKQLELYQGNYSAKFEFNDFPLTAIKFEELAIEHDGTIFEGKIIYQKETELQTIGTQLPAQATKMTKQDIVIAFVDYDFVFAGFFISNKFDQTKVLECEKWSDALNDCETEWKPKKELSLQKGLNVFKLTELEPDTNDGFPNEFDYSDKNELVEAIKKLRLLRENNRHFESNFSRERLNTLRALFEKIEINLQCTSTQLTQEDLQVKPIESPPKTPQNEPQIEYPQDPLIQPNIQPLEPSIDANLQEEKTINAIYLQDISVQTPLQTIESQEQQRQPQDPNNPDTINGPPEIITPQFFTNEWEKTAPQKTAWLQNEDYLKCDGVSLKNEFKDVSVPPDTEKTMTFGGSPDKVKHGILLSNDTNEMQTRLVSFRFEVDSRKLESDLNTFLPTKKYELVNPTTKKIEIIDLGDQTFMPIEIILKKTSAIRIFKNENAYNGYYDWTDIEKTGHYVKTLVHEIDGLSIIETIMEIPIPANESVYLDPVYDLNSVNNFSASWYGGTTDDKIGDTNASDMNRGAGIGVQIVNADNNAYANDLLISAPLADINNSVDTGAVYLIKDIDKKAQSAYDLNITSNYAVKFYGRYTNERIGDTNGSGLGVQLLDTDGNGYKNDLIITASNSSQGGSRSGSIFYIRNIDTRFGDKNLSSSANYTIIFTGPNPDSFLGHTGGSGIGVQVANLDGNTTANDLLITTKFSTLNFGGVFIIKDINRFSGTRALSSGTSYNVRYLGGATNDWVGNSNLSGQGVQVVNVDNNTNANDLLLTAPNADINSKTDSGAVYLLTDVDRKSGNLSLSTETSFAVRWNGGTASDFLGQTNGETGVQVADIDGNGYKNDLLLTAPYANIGSETDDGAVYLIKDIDKKSNVKDLNGDTNYSVRWDGNGSSTKLGFNQGAGNAVKLANFDNNLTANDLIINSILVPLANFSQNGGIYIIKDINRLSGALSFSSSSSFFSLWYGSGDSESLGRSAGLTSALSSGDGIQIVNVDNNATANDLLVMGLQVNGVVYLVKDANVKSGSINIGGSYSVRWVGNAFFDDLGTTNGSGLGVQLANIDNNAWANDLLISCYTCDVNGKTNNGLVLLSKDIHRKSGSITTASGFDLRIAGGSTSDSLIDTGRSGLGAQIVDSDNNGYSNDVLLTAVNADINGKADAGAVYLLRDIDKKSGTLDLNSSDYFNQRWNGGNPNDKLGYTLDSNLGVQFVNIDNGGYVNDIVFTSALADINLRTDNGAVYLFKKISVIPSDFAFALSYPSTGCTEGKGSLDAGVTCDRLYFEATNLDQNTSQNKVDAEGQTSTIPFLRYDNQSTSPTDFNITMNFNATVPEYYKLKVSKIYGGWNSQCTGNTDSNCVQVDIDGTGSKRLLPLEDLYIGGPTTLNNKIFMKYDFSPLPLTTTFIDVNLQMTILTAFVEDDDCGFYHVDQNQQWTINSSGNDLNKMHLGTFFEVPSSNCYPGAGGDRNVSILSIAQAAFNQHDLNFSFKIDDPDANSLETSYNVNEESNSVLYIGHDLGAGFPTKSFYSSRATAQFSKPPTLYIIYSATPQNVGKATYTSGTQDFNLFAWGDFAGAPYGSIDRNTISTSISSD